jgi:hypothetical protein
MIVIYKQCVKLRTELLTNINVSVVTLLPLCMNVTLHEGDLLSSWNKYSYLVQDSDSLDRIRCVDCIS